MEALTNNLTREDVESGIFQVFEDADTVNDENVQLWQWLENNPDAAILNNKLPNGHWLAGHLIHEYTEDEVIVSIEVEPIGKWEESVVETDSFTENVVLCKSVSLRFGVQEIVVENTPIYSLSHGILVPDGASDYSAGALAEIIASYTDEYDTFNESDFDADYMSINKVVQRLRSKDFATAVCETLEREDLAHLSGIAGKQFLATFTNEPKRGYEQKNLTVVDMEKVLNHMGIDQEKLDAAIMAVLEAEKATKSAE